MSDAPKVQEKNGLFVFEGADAVGKTGLAKGLLALVRADGYCAEYLSFPGHDPASIGGLVYDIHHNPSSRGISGIDPTALQILHVAAHADSIARLIRPLLEQGKSVILDRFWWSMWVYGVEYGVSPSALRHMVALESVLWRPIRPAIVWMITRKSPLRPENSGWRGIQERYMGLAKKQAAHVTVQIVHNDESLESSLGFIHGSFKRFQDGNKP